MTVARLTKRTIDALPPSANEYFVWDRDLTGFGLRVQATGAKTYVVKYRAGTGRAAPTRRITLGSTTAITPDQGRSLARKTLGAVAHGDDPAASKAAERKAATLAELAAIFLEEHVAAKRKNSTATHYRDLLERLVLPEFGTRKIDKVSTGDIARLHARLRNRPYQANRMLAVVGSLYGFAIRRKLVRAGTNPAQGIEKYPEEGRERYLSNDELARLGESLRLAETEGLPYDIDPAKPKAKHAPRQDHRRTIIAPHAAAALRLLIFTGARLREILRLEWSQVDFERGLLWLGDSKTGKKTIVLNAPALALLSALPRIGRYVIAGDNEQKPRSDLKRPWAAISKHAGLNGVRLHDLRHTHASFGAGLGLGLPIIGKLLGHSQPSTTARYAHLDADPLRRASEHIGSRLATAMGEKRLADTGHVVSIKVR